MALRFTPGAGALPFCMMHPDALAARAAHLLLRRALADCLPLALLLGAASTAQAQTTSTYAYTGSTDSYVVPAGVTQLTVVATGAYNGAVVQATVAVVSGETLTVVVDGGGYYGGGSGTSSGFTRFIQVGGGGSSWIAAGRNGDNNVGFYTTAGNLYLVANGAVTNQFVLTSGGSVGIGTPTPGTRLDVIGAGSNGVDLRVNGRLRTGDANNQGGVWLNEGQSQFVGQFDATKLGLYNGDWRLVVDNTGKVGIGTTGPAFPLDVQSTATTGAYAFGYLNPNGQTGAGSIGANGVGISIRATGRILSSEFNAVSDRRLKVVVGPSDRAAYLALLN